METKYLIKKLKTVLDALGEKESPECGDYIDNLFIGEDELLCDDPYTIANELLQCDKPDDLPRIIRDFIEELFTAAYEEGNVDALNDLGALYYEGSRGFTQDFTMAVNCYKLAAEKGSRQAQENLGYCYYYGRNMPVDYEKAFHYFALGAFDGHLISLYKIGDMYRNGHYVEKDPKEAFAIYVHCLDLMTDESARYAAGPVFLRVGDAFLNGIGTEADPKKALVCFQKAETFLYDMVAGGDAMYKKSLEAAIDGQERARAKLAGMLPKQEWKHE